MNESSLFAENVCKINYDDLSEKDIDITKKSILDSIGVILAASTLGEGCGAFIDIASFGEGKKESTILGFNTKVPAYMAAFANGSMAHALDFEDSHDGALVHPSATTVPAALAVSEMLGNVKGREFITAVALGNDLSCRLGLALYEDLFQYGWYSPPIMGAFGAATVAAKLLKLNADQIVNAFSLVLCQATCSAEFATNSQSTIRSVRDAFSTKAGVLSALLAQKDVKGFAEPFEGKAGLFGLYARGNYNAELLVRDLGRTFEGTNVSFKPWPSCRFSHSYIEAVLKIIEENDLSKDEIRQVDVIVTPVNKVLCEPIERKRKPRTSIDAKFSLPFILATAIVKGKVELDSFSGEVLKDEDVLNMAEKVTYNIDESLSKKESIYAWVEIHAGNKTFSKHIKYGYGHPQNPISTESLKQKFIDCAKYTKSGLSHEKSLRICDLIMSMEDVDNISSITALF